MKCISFIISPILILVLQSRLHAQQPAQANWQIDAFDDNCFIENQGQFTNIADAQTLFYAEEQGAHIHFSKKSISYKFYVVNREKEKEFKREMEEEEKEKAEKSRSFGREGVYATTETDRMKEAQKELELHNFNIYDEVVLSMEFLNANPNVQVIPQGKLNHYYNYSMSEEGTEQLTHVPAFEKLVYKNLYKNIDLVYEFHPEGGIKYAFTLHPNANPSNIKIKYTGTESLYLDEAGNLQMNIAGIKLQDMAPVSFVEKNNTQQIPTNFELKGSILSIQLREYDPNKTTVIDPWVSVLTINNTDKGLHVESDNAGNVYVFGGGMGVPAKIKKFDNTGALLWTWGTGLGQSGWFGTLEVDKGAGECYITGGGTGRIKKCDTGGSLVWNQSYSPWNQPYEIWTITYDCNYNKLYTSGRHISLGNMTYMQVNPVNGDSSGMAAIGVPQEVRAIAPGPDGNFYNMSLTHLNAMCNNFNNIFVAPHNHSFDYFGTAYDGANTPATNNGIAVSANFIYTSNSDSLSKWNIADGSFVASVKIPNGVFEGGSGVLVDDCENAYVGTNDGIYKFDQNLNLITSVSIPNGVYDLDFAASGEVVATGQSFVGSYNINSCGAIACLSLPTTQVSPDTTICPGDTTQIWATGGIAYSWSPSAGLNDTTISNPMASPTSNTTYYVEIIIDSCTSVFDSVTVSLAQNPLTVSPDSSAICPGDSITLNVSGSSNYLWSPSNSLNTDTGATVIAFPSITTTYTVTGVCAQGAAVVTVHPAPDIIATVPAVVICPGDSLGMGVQGGVTYSWAPSNSLNVDTGDAVIGFPTITTTYTVTGIDSNGCVGSDDATIAVGTPSDITVTVDQEICEGNSVTLIASGATTYFWSPPNGLNTTTNDTVIASPTSTTLYIVEGDDTGCPDTDTVTVTVNPAINADINNTHINCPGECTGMIDVVANGGTLPFTYQWSLPGNTTAQAEQLCEGAYSVTITDSKGCEEQLTTSINVLGQNPIAAFGSNPDRPTELEPRVDFYDLSQGNISTWEWVFFNETMPEKLGTAYQQDPSFTYPNAGLFPVQLTVTTEEGCMDDTLGYVEVFPIGGLFIPNAFTPNNDKLNNTFNAVGTNVIEYRMLIFDRWGEHIFTSNSLDEGWDGTYKGRPAQNGVYVYKIDYQLFGQGKEFKIGTVTLVD